MATKALVRLYKFLSEHAVCEVSHAEMSSIRISTHVRQERNIDIDLVVPLYTTSYDFLLNNLEHQLNDRHIELDKWYSETIASLDLREPLGMLLASRWCAVKKQISKMKNRIRGFRRKLSCSTFKLDVRLSFRKKMNVIFKNLDDEHISL
jgi:hypothetical protein